MYLKKKNEYADLDDLGNVSSIVNAGSPHINTERLNGYEERKNYYLILKNFFDYENCK